MRFHLPPLAVAAAAAFTLLDPPAAAAGATAAAPASAPAPFFSFYKDTSIAFDWKRSVARTRVSGTLRPLAADLRLMGARAVTLAFANGECGRETWTGAAGAAVARANRPLLEEAGLRYVVSTGGQGGLFTCGSEAGMRDFIARWDSPLLAGLDYDIEEQQTQAQIDDLVRRAAELHVSHPALRVSFTVATEAPNQGAPVAVAGLGHGERAGDPFDPFGDVGRRVMDAITRVLGWDGTAAGWPAWVTIDLMTMDYTDRPAPKFCVVRERRCQMGESAVQAAHDLQSAWNVPYSAIELTSMLGRNDNADEAFTLPDVDRVWSFAAGAGLAGVHLWSYDRDTPCPVGKARDTCNSMGPGLAPYAYLQRFQSNGAR